ncbi:hypothetical protein HDU98_010851 [Podochytrium sp. JEL0797]|nr:hypothetical protein HDU98_010851 [Podochytrium sp. JEL0797]
MASSSRSPALAAPAHNAIPSPSPSPSLQFVLGIDVSFYPGQTSPSSFFDICNTCNATTTNGVFTLDPLCADIDGIYDLEAECGPTGPHPIHVVPGSWMLMQIDYEPQANLMQFVLRYHFPMTANVPSPWNDTKLNYASEPNGFYPANKGRSPIYYNLTVPDNILMAKHPFDNGFYQLGWFGFAKGKQQSSDFVFHVVSNVTIDLSNSNWVFPPDEPPFVIPTSSPTDSTSNNLPPTFLYVFGTFAAVLFVIFTVAFFVLKRRDTVAKNSLRDAHSMIELIQEPKQADHLSIIDLEDHSDDESVVVFKKSRSGAYTPSMNSHAGGGGGGSSVGSYPRSILKTSQQVQQETIVAHIYDPVVVKMQLGQQEARHVVTVSGKEVHSAMTHHPPHEEGGVLEGRQSTKRVVFKSTVETAVVDLSMPPAIGAVPNGLFDDSESEGEEEDDIEVVHFNDGGVERGMREVLGKAVEVDEDTESIEEGNASDPEDDEWRRESKE